MEKQQCSASGLSRGELKTLGLSSLGGILEFYDFIIVFFFAKIISQHFFPAGIGEFWAMLNTYGTFAAGYLASAKFKVIPNAILPYDVDTIPGATLYPFNGAWMVTSEILEKRIPPVASAIKKAMKDDESYPCVFRYTLYN